MDNSILFNIDHAMSTDETTRMGLNYRRDVPILVSNLMMKFDLKDREGVDPKQTIKATLIFIVEDFIKRIQYERLSNWETLHDKLVTKKFGLFDTVNGKIDTLIDKVGTHMIQLLDHALDLLKKKSPDAATAETKAVDETGMSIKEYKEEMDTLSAPFSNVGNKLMKRLGRFKVNKIISSLVDEFIGFHPHVWNKYHKNPTVTFKQLLQRISLVNRAFKHVNKKNVNAKSIVKSLVNNDEGQLLATTGLPLYQREYHKYPTFQTDLEELITLHGSELPLSHGEKSALPTQQVKNVAGMTATATIGGVSYTYSTSAGTLLIGEPMTFHSPGKGYTEKYNPAKGGKRRTRRHSALRLKNSK